MFDATMRQKAGGVAGKRGLFFVSKLSGIPKPERFQP